MRQNPKLFWGFPMRRPKNGSRQSVFGLAAGFESAQKDTQPNEAFD
jgi:hypothetical protein